MLSLLLDEHVSPKVALQLREKHPKMTVHALQEWQQGRYLSAGDDLILDAACQQSLTLVTYDVRTIPGWLEKRSQRGLNHAGVVFVSGRTIQSDNIGSLVKSLSRLWQERNKEPWENRVVFLTRV